MQEIDIQNWKRRSHYELFGAYTDPSFVISVRLDMTHFMAHKPAGHGFFAPFTYLLMNAANRFEGLRIRWVDGRPVIFDTVHPSYTVLLENENFAFQSTAYDPSYAAFQTAMERDIEAVKTGANATESDAFFQTNNRADLIYISSLPWIDTQTITNPLPYEDKMSMSIPRFNWGKCVREDDRYAMGLSVTLNHAYIDGFEASRMLQTLQQLLDTCETYF